MALRSPTRFHQHSGSRLTSAPAGEPVSLTELKQHLRITGSDEDEYLGAVLLPEARKEIEDTTGIALITQGWQLTLDRWPYQEVADWDGVREGHINQLQGAPSVIELPRYPLAAVGSVNVYDENSTSTSITVATVFDIDTISLRGRMALKQGQTWPIAMRSTNAIEINYTAGYGTAADVPAPIKRAIRNMAGYLYEHRGDCSSAEAYKASGARDIMNRYALREV